MRRSRVSSRIDSNAICQFVGSIKQSEITERGTRRSRSASICRAATLQSRVEKWTFEVPSKVKRLRNAEIARGSKSLRKYSVKGGEDLAARIGEPSISSPP